jgi:sulfoxide reductase heme-binding subunit YedZ
MRKNLLVFGLTMLITGIPALFVAGQAGYADESLRLVLRSGARLALLIYLLIFVARPLRQLRPSAPARWLVANRRYLGIAFAGVMTVHLVFLIWLRGFALNVPGIAAYLLILAMLVTSFDGPAAMLGPRRWRILHKTGLYYLGIAFAVTAGKALYRVPLEPLHFAVAVLMIGAAGIRVAAWIDRHRRRG